MYYSVIKESSRYSANVNAGVICENRVTIGLRRICQARE